MGVLRGTDLRQRLLAAGAVYVRRTRHGERWRMPNGAFVTLPTTKLKKRNLKNLLKQIERNS